MDSEFEQRLRRQPLKPLPGEWRADILAAVAAEVNRRQEVSRECDVSREFTFAATPHSWLSTLNHLLSTLLWPHPKAWAGLAAVWLVILALNFSMRDTGPVVAKKFTPPSPAVMAELRQQQRLLTELIGSAEMGVADRQRVLFPKPRSERAEMLAA